jgi:hypothetical protein
VRRRPGPRDPRYPVPAGKSLFAGGNRRGLPIGNLTSQVWANVYLNELDQFAKRVLGCRRYLRYVDDVVLLSEDPAQLLAWRDALGEFLRRVLRLELREPLPEPAALGRGVDFVGWKTWWSHRVVRRQTLGNLQARVRRFARRRVRRAFAAEATRIDLAARPLAELHASLASHAGYLRHGAAWRDWARLWDARPWLAALFMRLEWQVRPRWQTRTPRSFTSAYAALLRRSPAGCLVFLPVGRFVEFYGPQRLPAERVLGLRRARLARGAWAFTAGFHRRHTTRFALRALRRGHMVLLTRDHGGGRSTYRSPAVLLVPRGLARVR